MIMSPDDDHAELNGSAGVGKPTLRKVEVSEQLPGRRVAGRELGPRPRPVEGDLPQVADAGEQMEAEEVEQRGVREGRAVGVGMVAEDAVEDVVAFRGGGHDHVVSWPAWPK